MRNPQTIFHSRCTLFPLAVNEGSNFSTSLWTLVFFFLILSHPNVCKISRYTSFTGYFYDYKFLLYFCFASYLLFCGFSRKVVKNKKTAWAFFLVFVISTFASIVKRFSLVSRWNKYFLLFYFFFFMLNYPTTNYSGISVYAHVCRHSYYVYNEGWVSINFSL